MEGELAQSHLQSRGSVANVTTAAKVMASWNSLPFEIKSLILKHYVRDLLQSAPCFPWAGDPNAKSGSRVRRQTRNLLIAASEMRLEVIKSAEEVKEEVISVLEKEDPTLKNYKSKMSDARSAGIPLAVWTSFMEDQKRRLRNTVQYLIQKIEEGAESFVFFEKMKRGSSRASFG